MDLTRVIQDVGAVSFIEDVRTGKVKSSFQMAMKTLFTIEKIVTDVNWASAKELKDCIRLFGSELRKADPTETVPWNIVLRSLKIIREEYQRLEGIEEDGDGIGMMQTIDQTQMFDFSKFPPELQLSIQDSLSECKAEICGSAENISKEAEKHINNDAVIMTLGRSKTVEAFLQKAAKKGRRFRVIVAECAPFCNGHEMAKSLAEYGIETSVIPDSSMFMKMSRVTKVIIGTHSVMANGGLKAVSGAYTLALAAKYFSVPLMVLAALFKYTPQYLVSHDQVAFNKSDSPEYLVPFENGDLVAQCDVLNPVFDYVPPELVTVLIAGNKEGHSPSYVYHKIATVYHRKDYLF
ncbi:Translation initiation factor eIF-2B subunit beta [Halotydeus destructor]|nr:Translation initiation factor eIF-2B subunit beta [Halotydeus destructor]